MRILEQGVSNLEEGGEGSVEAVAMLNLAISTLLYERFGFIFYFCLKSILLSFHEFCLIC